MKLYHVTDTEHLDDIAASGLRPRSYWAANERVRAYYEDIVRDEGKTPVILVVDLADLDESKLSPDQPGIDEPITSAIGKDEEEIQEEWRASAQDWHASLEIVGSLRCDCLVPPSVMRRVEVDRRTGRQIERPLTEAAGLKL